MTFVLLFLGFFGVFFLVLYGLGIIRILPKSMKILEGKQTSADKNSKNNPNPLRTAKMRVNVSEDDDSSLMQRLDDLLFMAGIQMPFGRFLARKSALQSRPGTRRNAISAPRWSMFAPRQALARTRPV